MRILLVKCVSLKKDVPQYAHPLGLMYLVSYLRNRYPEHNQQILDLTYTKNPMEVLERRIQDFDPHLVGISAMTSEADNLHEVAKIVKQADAAKTTVAGGPYGTSSPELAIADPNIDVLVLGEGEETYADIVSSLSSGGDGKGIPGSLWRDNGDVVRGDERKPIVDLDEIPFPAWDMVDMDAYQNLGRAGNVRRNRYMGIFTSRGCPYQCSYCHRVFPKRFRPRSASNILEELQVLVDRYDIRDVEVYDDVFNYDMDRAKAVCRGIIERNLNLKISFPHGVRGDRLDRELTGLLAQAGTTNIGIAVDTASPARQRELGRNLNIKKVRQAIEWADYEGITTFGYFMLGFPGETEEEMNETIRFAENSRLMFASFFIVTPFPSTPLWEQTVARTNPDATNLDALNVFSGFYNLSALSGPRLRRMQRLAYWRFYRGRLFRILRSFHRLRVDWRNAAWIGLTRMFDRKTLSDVHGC